ncbi:Rossmann-like and DUF2520 domain-containing protein [Acetohalobium arabaticum]|uniref:NADP oxidoreductase coenzyme F420-dependent n=1 Tax=Acetohalobium arabaticum (strain ATCC 49924 / DSM 5501 / Z-7288) TaxID=574087 RepID=D9QSX6_ACEAZ|nr:Rossmann-like and DUF2520 domain-containing protein [Acetohalobium arabaticum]ADL11664.1 Domain of unknown function DUF2520 [Acetohalobium arabaticum DSM 5501]
MEQTKVVIIGAGAVGKSLGYLLANNGYQVLGFISRSLSSAQEGQELVGEGIATTEYGDFILKADLIFITTPDQVISQIATKLFREGLVKKDSCLVHCSGALTSEILFSEVENMNEIEYGRLSLHPLQSVADVRKGIEALPNSFFTIEGNEAGEEIGKKVLDTLDADYTVIQSCAKPLYHAAACVASNYLVTIVDLALKMNQQVGISSEKALVGLLPLMEGTLQNIKEMGIVEALTGPISRGDINIIENHLEALEEFMPENLDLYKELGTYTTDIARRKGSINQDKVIKLKKLLDQEGIKDE